MASNSPDIKKKEKGINVYKYNSVTTGTGSKILKKTLENGKVTYQDAGLTEENIKRHE